MLLKHFFVPKIAHSSYLLAGRKTCAVVDPQRDVDVYIQAARDLGVRITHVIETHLHADFISGHLELASRTGAVIVAPSAADCGFEHRGVAEGDTIELENMRLAVWETPGHTPEHVSYVVSDQNRGSTPVGVFTGDTLFVGDVGRPDLFPGRAAELAEKLYHSLHRKLLTLPDHCEVYPAHGAGSLCGRSMGAKWQTTIGYERLCNSALKIAGVDDFIRSLTSAMPPAPDHFSRCSGINRRGPELCSALPPLEEWGPDRFSRQLALPGHAVLDVRNYSAFSGQHIPGSWHLDLNGNFPTFAGWVLPIDRDFLVVADSYDDAVKANVWARRVGVDRIVACLDGGMAGWAVEGRGTARISLISARELHDRVIGAADTVLLDVRSPSEYADEHIGGAINIPAPDLRQRAGELDPDKPVYIICSTGNRSSLAASILAQNGFRSIANVAGGMTGYSAAGYARHCAVCINPHGPRVEEMDPLIGKKD